MKRLALLLVAGLAACDSLSDPARGSAVTTTPESPTTQITGALVGPEGPANTRVALLWTTENAITHGADAPAVAGHFTMSLGVPPSDTLLPDLVVTDQAPVTTNTFPVARAGFVVYVDLNGNEQLDLDEHGVTTDQIVGGNPTLVLTYVPDAPVTDYSNLRDDTKALPHAGYNLMGRTGESRVWSSLDRIDLPLDRSRLPGAVCERLKYSDVEGLRTDAGLCPEP